MRPTRRSLRGKVDPVSEEVQPVNLEASNPPDPALPPPSPKKDVEKDSEKDEPPKSKPSEDKDVEIKKTKNKENRVKKKKVNKKPKKLFERKVDDGSTSLAILTPGKGIVPGTERDRPVSLGAVVGRVKAGTSHIMGFREDRRNYVKPMCPIYYGGYSSHGPTYDSTFANMTLRESNLVGPYFDFRKFENAGVIKKICKEGDYSEKFVDHLLDLFNGRDIADVGVIEESNEDRSGEEDIDFDYLKTLENEGIDMSYISSLQTAYEDHKFESSLNQLSIEQQLELTAKLIADLAETQNCRLSRPPPPLLNHVAPPDHLETRLATQVVTNIGSLASKAYPGQVVDVKYLRKTMGVVPPPSSQPSLSSTPQVVPHNGEVAHTNGVVVQHNGISNGFKEPSEDMRMEV